MKGLPTGTAPTEPGWLPGVWLPIGTTPTVPGCYWRGRVGDDRVFPMWAGDEQFADPWGSAWQWWSIPLFVPEPPE